MGNRIKHLLPLLLALGLPAAAAGEAAKPKVEAKKEAVESSDTEAPGAPAVAQKRDAAQAEASGDTATDASARRTALVWSVVLKVVNPDDARVALEKAVRELGGFVTFFNGSSISVKLPPGALPALESAVQKQGNLLEKTLTREDLTLRIAELRGILKSKREILARTRKFLSDADVPATLEIERTMTGLVMEIEDVRGSLRVMEERATFAVADISFEFRERDRIVYVSSPFGWLNTVDLARFNEEF